MCNNFIACDNIKDKIIKAEKSHKTKEINKYEFIDISMIDEKNGWSFSSDGILKTKDGGNSWKKSSAIKLPVCMNDDDNHRDVKRIMYKFINKNVAFIAYKNKSKIVIYRTLNEGDKWDKNVVTLPKKFTGDSCKFKINAVNEDILFALISTENEREQYIYRSDNMGKQWKSVYTPNDTDLYIKDLEFIDNKQGFYIAESKTSKQYNIYITNDGGANWNKQILNIPGNDYKNTIIYTPKFYKNKAYLPIQYSNDKETIVAIYKSNNKGKSWIFSMPIHMKSPIKFIYDIDKNGIFWITDSSSDKIYRLQNDGEYLQEVCSSVNLVDKKIQFLNVNKGFLINNNKIYITNDRGITWSKLLIN